nr:MAG TPA: hypothetical protein [Caudoviricetes sp.]
MFCSEHVAKIELILQSAKHFSSFISQNAKYE